MKRFVAFSGEGRTGYVMDTLRNWRYDFDSYTAAKQWAEIANNTPC